MQAKMVRKIALAVGVVALGLLGTVSPASASGPVIFDAQFNRHGTYENCGSFNVNLVTDVNAHFEQFFSDSGQLVLERRHVQFTGTLTNATSGATLPYEGDYTRTLDVSAATVSLIGTRRLTQVPGDGVLAIAAGRLVIDTATGVTISESGQTDEAYNAAICRLLG